MHLKILYWSLMLVKYTNYLCVILLPTDSSASVYISDGWCMMSNPPRVSSLFHRTASTASTRIMWATNGSIPSIKQRLFRNPRKNQHELTYYQQSTEKSEGKAFFRIVSSSSMGMYWQEVPIEDAPDCLWGRGNGQGLPFHHKQLSTDCEDGVTPRFGVQRGLDNIIVILNITEVLLERDMQKEDWWKKVRPLNCYVRCWYEKNNIHPDRRCFRLFHNADHSEAEWSP